MSPRCEALLSVTYFLLITKRPYLRKSFYHKNTLVSELIYLAFPNTIILALCAIFFALLIGIPLGVFAAFFKDKFIDRFISFASVLGMSLPSFFSSVIIAWIFGFLLHNYTGLNMTGSLYEVDDYGRGSYIQLKNLILPAITLGIRPLSVIIQLCRSSLIEVISMDYIRTARSKGLSRASVFLKHALRNAMNPVVTAISGWFASMLAGAVFVEYIFGWNGIGKEIVDALNNMDLPLVMGSILFIAFIFVIINIIVDLVYIWLDPRIRIK